MVLPTRRKIVRRACETLCDQMSALPIGMETCGIAIVANDKVLNWLLPFLESYLATNADVPLHLIPFDDNVAVTRRAAERYSAIWVDDIDTREVDALAKRLYPLFPHHRRRLHKLQGARAAASTA